MTANRVDLKFGLGVSQSLRYSSSSQYPAGSRTGNGQRLWGQPTPKQLVCVEPAQVTVTRWVKMYRVEQVFFFGLTLPPVNRAGGQPPAYLDIDITSLTVIYSPTLSHIGICSD